MIPRAIIILGTFAFVALILWGFGLNIGFDRPETHLFSAPWVIVTIADLYLGLILFSIVVFMLESNKLVAFAWIAPGFVLGNLVPAVYLLVRGLRLLSERPPEKA